jgi:hypothetical protein
MLTQCTQESFCFHQVGRRQVVGRFDGGRISSDGGALLLGRVEHLTHIMAQFAACFTDHRDAELIEHPLAQLVAQRVYGLALGYEDLNDHDALRTDPLLAALVGCDDPLGRERRRKADRGKALAGKSTLNRLELTPVGADERSRYKKIVLSVRRFERLLVDLFVQAHTACGGATSGGVTSGGVTSGGVTCGAVGPEQIVLDVDATDDPIHGNQLGRFFHGYYDSYCYLPLYVTCGEHVLCARLRPSNIDAARGVVGVLSRIIQQIREHWPQVRIIVRGDSGFCRENLMNWCEQNQVDYLLGLAKNKRLLRMIGGQMHEAKQACEQSGQAARVFTDLDYRTRKSWSRSRRTVAKAEHLPGSRGENPRFVVASISVEELDARTLYEDHYCPRGDMENRIKEQQLDLFADRTSCATMRANQIRLALSTIAYTLLSALRRLGLKDTALAHAQCGTIRSRLLKIGARVIVTARKVWVSLSQSFPLQEVFAAAYRRLTPTPITALGP